MREKERESEREGVDVLAGRAGGERVLSGAPLHYDLRHPRRPGEPPLSSSVILLSLFDKYIIYESGRSSLGRGSLDVCAGQLSSESLPRCPPRSAWLAAYVNLKG